MMGSLSIAGLLAQAAPWASESARPWLVTGAVVLAALIAIVVHAYATQSGVIARATTKEACRQPVFWLLLVIGIAVLLINTFLSFFSFGEDVKMLKDCGLATLLISGLLLACWTASTSIAEEIEGKTAMTLLSKPINRRQFIIGKYFGIFQAVLFLLVPLMAAMLFLIYYKVGYDARESSAEVPNWAQWTTLAGMQIPLPTGVRLEACLQILPGFLLILLEVAVMTAVSVAIATRLPMIVNLVTCLAIFVIGHLSQVLVGTVFEGLEFVKFMANLIATVLPGLEYYNTQNVVATGTIIPPDYIGYLAIYSVCYTGAAILLAMILFEDRDLA